MRSAAPSVVLACGEATAAHMQPTEYLRVLRRRWWIVALACALGLGVGAFTARRSGEGPAQFQATHTLGVVEPEVDVEGQTRTLSPIQVAVFGSVGAVPERAAEVIGYDGRPQELADRVDIEGDDELGIVEITATDGNGQRAADIANAFSDELVSLVSEEREADRQQQLEDVQQELSSLEQRMAEVEEEGS